MEILLGTVVHGSLVESKKCWETKLKKMFNHISKI